MDQNQDRYTLGGGGIWSDLKNLGSNKTGMNTQIRSSGTLPNLIELDPNQIKFKPIQSKNLMGWYIELKKKKIIWT